MRRTLMAMMPKPSPEHKSLLLALDDRMCNRMKQEELEAICYRWAYQYALEAMKFIPLPYKPPTVMEFDNMSISKKRKIFEEGGRTRDVVEFYRTKLLSTLHKNKSNYDYLLKMEVFFKDDVVKLSQINGMILTHERG